MERLTVERMPPLPDTRVLLAFLWGEAHPVDTEGDCRYPADRGWTELHVESRVTGEVVDVFPADDKVHDLVVKGGNAPLVSRVAYFLAAETGAAVRDESGAPLDLQALRERMGSDFSVEEATRRAASTRFRRATEQDPYPVP